MKKLLILCGLIILLAAGSSAFLFAFANDAQMRRTDGETAQYHFTDSATREKEQKYADVADLAEPSDEEPVQKEPYDKDSAETGQDAPASARGALQTEYAYAQLSAEEQQVYREILDGLQSLSEETPVSTGDQKALERIFTCVMNDHPEIFYVDGYTVTTYQKGGVTEKNGFSGNYLYDADEIARRKAAIEKETEKILAGAPAGDDYEIVKYVYEYIISHTEYVMGAADNQNLCSVFLNGKSVCQGYAKAAQYLLEHLGIECIFVTGTVETGEAHAWNVVRADGAYYHVDTTWGDASYVIDGSSTGYEGKQPEINYEYLCVPDEQLFRTHRAGNIVPPPVCESMDDNYYVREDAYFTHADMEMTEKLFAKAYGKEHGYVTLKCADDAVYAEMEQKLIGQQEVFNYMRSSDGTVAYTCNKKQRTLSFWL